MNPPFFRSALQPESPSGPDHVDRPESKPGQGQPPTAPASVLTWLQLRGWASSSHRRHFHFLKLYFHRNLPRRLRRNSIHPLAQ
ncbi:hypothetical protein VZT92_014917 [Zoarces viviparus]|uniref:Uncharacterized protein n=1 Tax=Zoarces viviparus TaxID=48416 RepID=A0AAW1ETY8_ZOAVI